MQLFYHVTRDIELPRPGRRGAGGRTPGLCEICGARMRAPEPSATGGGGAPIAVCPACRDRLDRSAIQIHFCDVCGVSVPREAVEGGRFLTADGRIACAACRGRGTSPAAGVAAAPAAPDPRTRWGLLAALLALALAAGIGAALLAG